MKNTKSLMPLVLSVGIFASPTFIPAQSGQSPAPATTSGNKEAPTLTPAQAGAATLGKTRLVTAYGVETFVQKLNDHGNQGYRLDKSLSYGGEGPTRSYAAVLQLDANNKYEYDWISTPDKRMLESQLNFQAKQGFNFVNAHAITICSKDSADNEDLQNQIRQKIFRMKKGEAFLFERRNGSTEQTREYRVFIAKVHLGDSAQKTIQAALEEAAQQGFRPVKVLFTRNGLLDFNVSALTEKDLKAGALPKIEYHFIKKTSGFPEAVNTLAAQGGRFITGRRIGTVRMALMAKQANENEATIYTFIDEKKYAKEFDKTVALGNSFRGVIVGDMTCGSEQVENEALVFAKNTGGEKHEYRIHNLLITTAGDPTADSLQEFNRLVGESFQIKDLFYFNGLKLILEK
jgi:hypothetical protein